MCETRKRIQRDDESHHVFLVPLLVDVAEAVLDQGSSQLVRLFLSNHLELKEISLLTCDFYKNNDDVQQCRGTVVSRVN